MFSSRTLRIINNAEAGVCEERMDNNNIDYPGLPKNIANIPSEDDATDSDTVMEQENDPDTNNKLTVGEPETEKFGKTSILNIPSENATEPQVAAVELSPVPVEEIVEYEIEQDPGPSRKLTVSQSVTEKRNAKSTSSYSEDSDDSIKDANYVNNSSTSSTSSSCSSSSESSSSESSKSQTDNVTEKKAENSKERGKKRKLGPEKWVKNVAKCLRNSGKEYKNPKTKKIVPQKQLLPPCGEKCKLKCYNKVSEEDRTSIFNKYWALGSLQRQRDFIGANMTTVKPRYKYAKEGSNRRPNNAFFFEVGNRKIRVCKLFFKNTLSINDRPIRTVLSKRDLEHPQFIKNDQRGKHAHHHKLDDELKQSVRQHIDSIPRIPSHYCRAHTSREFIEGGLTIADLHRDYKNLREESGRGTVNYVMYNKIFNEEYNISFFTPKKDQCELCVAFENGNDNDKKEMKEKYEDHLHQKELSRIEKQADKESADFVAVYDLQAVLPCPKGSTSCYYYVSKLNVFNFTIYDIKSNAVVCYVWNEAQGNRGANEIGSCVLSYLQNLSNIFNEDRNVIFYSDNCAGQQKNKFMFSMYLYAVKNLQKIQSITHKYLITGHTQNEGDNAHSLIERSIKRSLRSGPIYLPEQYVTLIRTAKKSGNPYTVEEMTYDDFYDLKNLANSVGLGNGPQSVKISEIQIMRVEKKYPNKIFYKTSFDQEHFEEVEVEKARSNRGRKSESEALIKVYKNKVGITEKKKKSLLSLFNETAKKRSTIPKSYKDYYLNL